MGKLTPWQGYGFPQYAEAGARLTNVPVPSALARLSGVTGGNKGEEEMPGPEPGGPSPGGLYLALQDHP